jgi:hypothetical protein
MKEFIDLVKLEKVIKDIQEERKELKLRQAALRVKECRYKKLLKEIKGDLNHERT